MATPQLTLGDWTFEPTVTAGLLAVAVAYGAATRRGVLRPDDDVGAWLPSPRLRPVMFGLGLLAAVIALDSPIDRGGDRYLFWLHMIQHLLLMMVAPPLCLLGVAGARPRAVASRFAAALRLITRPWPACAVFNAVLLVWHIPTLYEATLTTEPIHVVEHLTFIAAGVVLWWPVVDPLRPTADATPSAMTKIAMLVVAGVPPTVLGFVFVAAPHALYQFYAFAPRLWGFSAVADQQLAGVIMFGLGNVIYFIAVAVIFVRMFGDAGDDEAGAARYHEAASAAGRAPRPAAGADRSAGPGQRASDISGAFGASGGSRASGVSGVFGAAQARRSEPARTAPGTSGTADLVGSRAEEISSGGAMPHEADTPFGEQTQ